MPLIINDRVDVALALGPDVGVHVGQVRLQRDGHVGASGGGRSAVGMVHLGQVRGAALHPRDAASSPRPLLHHVLPPQSDLPAAEARRLLGPGRILGVSCKNVEEARRAVADGADYLGCGAGATPT